MVRIKKEGAISAEERRENVETYRRRMKDDIAEEVLAARSAVVLTYRRNKSVYPDGIDTKYDRWFYDEHLDEAGNFIGPKDWFDVKRPDEEVILSVLGKGRESGADSVNRSQNEIASPANVVVTETIHTDSDIGSTRKTGESVSAEAPKRRGRPPKPKEIE